MESKEQKEANFKYRMDENRKITALSDKQHDAIQYLCRVRHEMHSGQKAFFLSDDPRHAQFELFLGKDGQGTINKLLSEAGLPTVTLNTDIFKVETDKCFKREDFNSDYDYEMARARAFDHSAELAENLNTSIETYLENIDRTYGTKYKPYGKFRFYKETKTEHVQAKYERMERMNEKKRVFVDMDGTLAKFNPVSTLEDLMEPGYFRNLEPNQNVVDAISELYENGEVEVYILSAVLSDSPTAQAEKEAWLKEHLPDIPEENHIFMKCGQNKADFIPGGIRQTDILLDDYTHNLSQWQPPAIGVKLMNDINHTRGSWEGDRISFTRGGHDIANRITRIAKGTGHTYDQNRISERSLADIYFGEIKKGTVAEIIVRLNNMANTLNAFPKTQEEIKRLFSDFQIGVEDGQAMVRDVSGDWQRLDDAYPYYEAVKDMVENAITSASSVFMEEAKEHRGTSSEPQKVPERPVEKTPEPEPEPTPEMDDTWSFNL